MNMSDRFIFTQQRKMLTREEFENYDVRKFNNGKELGDFIYEFIREHPEITHLDLTKWDMSNVKEMSLMFGECHSLKSIDVSNWNTSKDCEMFDVFDGCEVLNTIDILPLMLDECV